MFADWLLDNGVWGLLVGKSVDKVVVASAEYVLRMVVNRRGKNSEERFKEFVHLIW